ncbi:MAG: hypothetical protein QF464_04620 [Myxococcota bacterium]|jgi:hypothetical protein|nr:hypothetical protein [Myxococcota bacterium]
MKRHPLLLGTLVLILAACGDADTGTTDADQDSAWSPDTVDIEQDAGAGSADGGDGATQDTSGSPDSNTQAGDGAGEEDTEGPGEIDSGPPPCDCQIWEHCDADGQCVEDLCDQGTTTCAPPTEDVPQGLMVCSDDGSAVEIVPCGDGEVCHLGLCQVPMCEPNASLGCVDGQLEVCNSIGTETLLIPCQGGSACLEGECVPVEANVILLIDTSGSMNAVDLAGTFPGECEGADCPPWTWPQCDDLDAPQTRLGKAKKALQGVLASEEASGARLALQRFPQKFDLFKLLGQSDPTCEGVPLIGFDLFSKDNAQVHLTHQIETMAPDGSDLAEIMPVAFGSDQAVTNAEILRWVDFEHVYESDGEACDNLNDCSMPIAHKACVAGECAVGTEPELRAMGKTPLGRALFYAGEIYRHTVVVEGRTCTEDADCHSPHYSCVDGACHDPFRTCRPNLVVLFSDGAETLDTNPELFFHARNQAKRLQYGLGCASEDDCLNGAVCTDGACQLPADTPLPSVAQVVDAATCYKGEVVDDQECEQAPGAEEACCQTRGVCHLTSVPCANNDACEPYPYPCGGSASTCNGTCEEIDTGYVDSAGQDVLRDATGAPFSVTVHVVDAADAPTGTLLVAAFGGGQHAVVDLDDLDGILDVFTPLLDVKANTDACP